MLLSHGVFAQAQIVNVDVGVLATRGGAEAKTRWQPTMDWLSERVPNTHFVLHATVIE